MLKPCRCIQRLSNKVMNTKIVCRTALQLEIYEFLNGILLLLQTPVPNYQDVDLSFVYEIRFPTMDPVKVEQSSIQLYGTIFLHHVESCRTTTEFPADCRIN